ncbi:MAG: hypothetical protein Q8N96_13860 [Methylovulum sp.]|nr:hypothetical protein [Methylovulum sp.]
MKKIAPYSAKKSVFDVKRCFSQRSIETGLMEWFFLAREGVFGSFVDEKQAEKELETFKLINIKAKDDGGRHSMAIRLEEKGHFNGKSYK